MRRSRKLVGTLATLIGCLLVVLCNRPSLGSSLTYYVSEFQITDTSYDDWYPDVDGNIVIWRVGAYYDIYGYDLTSREYFVISEETEDEDRPRISGDWVAWVVDDGQEVRAKNLKTGEQRTVFGSIYDTIDISGDYIVWNDYYRNVWLYHIPTEAITQVTTAFLGSQDKVAVGPPWVAWSNHDGSNPARIQGYNIDTTEIVTFSLGIECGAYNPDVSDGILVWQGQSCPPMENSNIFGMDLNTGEVFTVTYNSGSDTCPRTDGKTIVWNSDDTVLAYDIATGETVSVTSPATGDEGPSVSGNVVVWRRLDNGPTGDWNIYGAHIYRQFVFLPLVLRSQNAERQ